MYENLTFIHSFHNNQVPNILYDIIKKSQHKYHKYPTKFLSNNFYIKKYSLNCTKISIFQCCGTIFFIKKKRLFDLIYIFQSKLKSTLLQV